MCSKTEIISLIRNKYRPCPQVCRKVRTANEADLESRDAFSFFFSSGAADRSRPTVRLHAVSSPKSDDPEKTQHRRCRMEALAQRVPSGTSFIPFYFISPASRVSALHWRACVHVSRAAPATVGAPAGQKAPKDKAKADGQTDSERRR